MAWRTSSHLASAWPGAWRREAHDQLQKHKFSVTLSVWTSQNKPLDKIALAPRSSCPELRRLHGEPQTNLGGLHLSENSAAV